VVELVDTLGSGSSDHRSCEFNSRLGHISQIKYICIVID